MNKDFRQKTDTERKKNKKKTLKLVLRNKFFTQISRVYGKKYLIGWF